MAQGSIHFEIFVRVGKNGPWKLHGAMAARGKALEEAKQILSEGRAIGVRVVKESFNEETGDFLSLTVFEDGQTDDPKGAKKGEVQLPCFKPDDLYSFHGRRTIATLLQGALSRWHITATELLHHAGHVERLESAGTELQHAVQKVSVRHAGTTGQPVQQIVLKLNKLVDSAIERVLKDEKKKRFPIIAKKNFAKICEGLANDPGAEYLVNGAIAKHIEGAKDWGAKLKLILSLMSDLPKSEKANELALECIDSLIAEILSGNAALSDLIGKQENLGEALLVLSDLFLGKATEDKISKGRGLISLSKHFASGQLVNARSAIAHRVLKEISGVRRLYPESLEQEVRAARQLATKMVMGRGTLITQEEILEAFTTRSRIIVVPDTIQTHIGSARTHDEKLKKLLDLEENIIGGENKRKLVSFVTSIVTSHHFETRFTSNSASPVASLTSLAKLQERILKSGFQDLHKREMASTLDKVATRVEKEAGLFRSIATAKLSSVERVMSLLRLLNASAFTKGQLDKRAREILASMLQTPQFKTDLAKLASAQVDEDKNPIGELQSLLAKAGVAEFKPAA